jgi:hypothetical protein
MFRFIWDDNIKIYVMKTGMKNENWTVWQADPLVQLVCYYKRYSLKICYRRQFSPNVTQFLVTEA